MIDSKTQIELINQLAEICEKLGWAIGVPADDDTEMVSGLIVGTEEFINSVIQYMDAETVEVFSKEEGSESFTEPAVIDKKKIMH